MSERDNPPELVPEPAPLEPEAMVAKPRSKRLRFPVSGYRVTPHGFVNLDKALDRLGRKRLPGHRDLVLGFKETPFQYRRSKKGFFQNQLASRSAGYKLRKEKFVPPSLSRRRAYRAADCIYTRVRTQLMRAIERAAVSAKILTSDAEIVDISTRGLWVTPMRAIFYSGFLRQSVGGSVHRCCVLVDEQSFHPAWNTCVSVPMPRP